MARVTEAQSSQFPDSNVISLSRLLDRLQSSLLSPDSDRRLRRSSYERNKVGANLEHARSLLLKLEREGLGGNPQSRNNGFKTDLQAKRSLIKQLQNRLYELSHEDSDEDEQDSASDSEDLLARYAPAVKDTSDSFDSEDTSPNSKSQAQVAAAAESVSSSLRSRRAAPPATDTGASTSNAFQPKATFATSSFAPKSSAGPSTSTTDALLTHHTSEQEALTNSLLTLASALKDSTISFSDSLTASNPLVDRATSSLDKNVGGMEAAGQKMSTLRRMTEGRGLWGRWMLYAYIAALWVASILLVFVLPKLRF